MAKFKVAVEWVMTKNIEIEADSLSEAILEAEDLPNLPDDGDYLEGSFEVNHDFTRELNKKFA